MNIVTGNTTAQLEYVEAANGAPAGADGITLPDFSDFLSAQFTSDALMSDQIKLETGEPLPQGHYPWQVFATNMPVPVQLRTPDSMGDVELIDLSAYTASNQGELPGQTKLPVTVLQAVNQSNSMGNITSQLTDTTPATKLTPDIFLPKLTELQLKPDITVEHLLPSDSTEQLPQSLSAVDGFKLTQAESASVGMKDTGVAGLYRQMAEPVIAGRIAWMLQTNTKSAEIRLDPPELGSIDIQVNVTKDSANVTITAPNSQARELLEAGMARLKEMLENSGVNLAGLDIRQGNHGDARQQFDTEQRNSSAQQNTEALDVQPVDISSAINSNGLLDTYA